MSGPAPAPGGEPHLRITDLSKLFGRFVALRDITLDIAEGEFVCFLGPSGCGKTTLLRAIAGLEIQTSGRIELLFTDRWHLSRHLHDVAAERMHGIQDRAEGVSLA